MAQFYIVLCILLLAIGWMLRPWGLLLIWPAASLAIIAAAYLRVGPGVFRKRAGALGWTTRLALGPYFIGGWLTLPAWRRRGDAWADVTPHLVLGRRLSDAEARAQIERGVGAVLDLTAECSAPRPFRSIAYRNLPILDLTVPTPAQLADAVNFIRAQASEGRRTYLHCKLGHSRSATVAAAYLIAEGLASDGAQAVALIRQVRPQITVRAAAVAALNRFAAARADAARS